MFKTYFKIAFRTLWKNKIVSSINIIGLSISIALSLLLFFYVRHEQSVDSFHSKKDHLFRLEATSLFARSDEPKERNFFQQLSGINTEKNQVVFPMVIAQDILSVFPEVKSITRMSGNSEDGYDKIVKAGDKVFKESHILDADDNFFQNFSFPLLWGNAKTALQGNNSVVITNTMAQKLFGNKNAVGKTLIIDGDSSRLYTITGVAKDVPANSGIRFNMVRSVTAAPDYQDRIKNRFNTSSHEYILELQDGVNTSVFKVKLNNWMRGYYQDALLNADPEKVKNYQWILRPLDECHYEANSWGHYTNPKVLNLLFSLFLLILLLACVNYILLAVSNVVSRIKEMGLRKIIGAGRWNLIMQSWFETLLTTVICTVVALLLAYTSLPVFNGMVNTQISFDIIPSKEILLAGIGLSLIISIIAGFYPAFVVSGTKPVAVLKSGSTFKINPRFSNPLVILQFSICIILVVSIIVVGAQMRHISRKDLGFDKEQILLIKSEAMGDKRKMIRERLFNYANAQPYILGMSGIGGSLTGSYNYNGFKLHGEQKWYSQIRVDYDYFKLLNIPVIEGRDFSKNINSDTIKKARACVVNETFFKLLGPDAKIGAYNDIIRSTIIGVSKDYNFETLTKEIGPQQHILTDFYENYFMFKVKGGEMNRTIEGFRKEWKNITNEYPFDFTFLDDSLMEMYTADLRWQKIINTAGVFAVFIACLGLFGFSLLSVANRAKEVGIRKVLGATIADISILLSRKMVGLIAVSLAIATPISWFLLNEWLQEFAYRINISWWMFLVAGLLVTTTAIITISFQTVKAALANPVRSLRAE